MLMPTRSSLSTVIVPARSGRRPITASTSSVCPLPCTPATPSTSPARTTRSTPSTARMPRSSSTIRPAIFSTSRPGSAGVFSTSRLTDAADHQRGQLVLRGVRGGGADRAAAPDHGDPVGDGLDLFELVGDEDDRLAGVGERAHDREQLVGLLRGEHRGRLVQDQQVDVAGERLDDLHPLLRADRQVLHQGVRVDRQAVALGGLEDVAAAAAAVQPAERAAPGLLGAERDVLRDREDGHQHEVLVHHADAGRDGVPRAAEGPRLAVHQDLALVRLQQAVELVHQGRLARAVLAEQRVHLAGLDGQVDVVVGHQVAEALGDAAQFESQRNLPEASRARAAARP